MKKDNERRTVVNMGEKITRVNIIDDGNAVEIFSVSDCKVNQKENAQSNVGDYIETYFPIVKASTLSLDDVFMKHHPETKAQKVFKERLTSAIKSGLTDFRAQRMDPTFTKDARIMYEAGRMPAVGESANWWKENAEQFIPDKRSRLGTTKERIAFLGLLIKNLVEKETCTVSYAWKAVCDQSKDLGHYWDSDNAKHDFEPTGSRKIGEWYDLANTCKYVYEEENSGFLIVGGSYVDGGCGYPLADVDGICSADCICDDTVGWLVLNV